jgi:hypothetical protein
MGPNPHLVYVMYNAHAESLHPNCQGAMCTHTTDQCRTVLNKPMGVPPPTPLSAPCCCWDGLQLW